MVAKIEIPTEYKTWLMNDDGDNSSNVSFQFGQFNNYNVKLTRDEEKDDDFAGVCDWEVVSVAHRGGGDDQEPDAVRKPLGRIHLIL